MSSLSWHQQNALRRNWKLRHKKAHIKGDDYIATGKMLCGVTQAGVYVDAQHAHKPENNVCKKCLAKIPSHSGATL